VRPGQKSYSEFMGGFPLRRAHSGKGRGLQLWAIAILVRGAIAGAGI